MIAYVKGSLEEISEDNAVIEVNGIGYNIKISPGTAGMLPALHQQVKMYTYTSVREDAFWLYGFLSKEELMMFKLLITVNGIGPKGALGILSVMSVRDLQFAIAAADGKMIAKAPGIGKKTAERVILDLRDKISLEDTLNNSMDSGKAIMNDTGISQAKTDAIEALAALGYASSDALKAVNQIEGIQELDTEQILKQALKYLF